MRGCGRTQKSFADSGKNQRKLARSLEKLLSEIIKPGIGMRGGGLGAVDLLTSYGPAKVADMLFTPGYRSLQRYMTTEDTYFKMKLDYLLMH